MRLKALKLIKSQICTLSLCRENSRKAAAVMVDTVN